MSERDQTALRWHMRSDHARDGVKFGGPLCNCLKMADRIMPMLQAARAEAWNKGYGAGDLTARAVNDEYPDPTPNPYEGETK